MNITDYTIEVPIEVIDTLQSMRQISGNENGGILLGSEIGEKHYRINRVSEPCMLIERSTRGGCTRDANKANEIIKREFELSNHTRFYLGEWHTHPENNPTPSSVDIASIYDVFSKSKIVIDGVFLAIVGRKSIFWGFHDGTQMHKIEVIVV
ncbi:Mov34/MPN/PAD-1 family protein [Bacteroides sp. UBA939]|uniref:Mov34/MPN/PAD-1 family protein n=1 Tax=Bacteroides sp. UBA939 TaxID=1946092 RepID=UPI0025BD656A|nr:Mov34/MPN/PAD-1 family protein [Bacteroides sp. UBA939]